MHDNARPHTVRLTVKRLESYGLDVLTRPPYSQDLAPFDYRLFTKLKEVLGGKRDENDDDVELVVLNGENESGAKVLQRGNTQAGRLVGKVYSKQSFIFKMWKS